MKLLFDQNLSYKLAAQVADVFAQSSHVRLLGMRDAVDDFIWAFARREEFTLVTKDDDFEDMAILKGYPPKVVVIRLGNCATSQVESLLRMKTAVIRDFIAHSEDAVLYLP